MQAPRAERLAALNFPCSCSPCRFLSPPHLLSDQKASLAPISYLNLSIKNLCIVLLLLTLIKFAAQGRLASPLLSVWLLT